MKKILFLIVAATLLSFSAMAQTPVYSFPFDNSYSASVGTGTFTSNTGTSFTTDRNGNANSAVSINNTGLSATLAGLPYGSAARSVSMWVKLNAMRVDYNYLYTYGTGTNGGYDGASITGTNVLGFTPSHSANLTNSATTWYQFVFTYDGATSRMYRNGTLIGTLALTKNTINNADLFKLGLTESGSGTFFNGAIDDLKIYNTALSDAQVSAAYVPPTTPTAIYTFPFDNSYSATVGTGTFTSNTGTSFTADRNGNANGAVNINNTGLSATLSGLSYGSVARTVSMWVKLNAMRVDYNYLYTYGTGTSGGYDGASITGTSALGFTPSHSATLTNVVSTWYQFVFTYDGTSSRIYQNGTLISTLALTKNTQNNANLFKLGLTELGSGTFFNGAIDDLSIYNYALSNAEVSAVYNGTVSTNDVATASNPIGVYPNPTANQISFSEVTNVQLHNVVGQVITNQKNVNSLDLSAQPAGMYLATFTDDKGKVLQVSKIVKK